jgi:hypothetical protein
VVGCHRPKVNEGRGEEEEKRKRNGYEGGKRWDLLELSCACGREGGSGREAVKKSEKIERLANGRSEVHLTLVEYLVEYLSHHVTVCQSVESQDLVE